MPQLLDQHWSLAANGWTPYDLGAQRLLLYVALFLGAVPAATPEEADLKVEALEASASSARTAPRRRRCSRRPLRPKGCDGGSRRPRRTGRQAARTREPRRPSPDLLVRDLAMFALLAARRPDVDESARRIEGLGRDAAELRRRGEGEAEAAAGASSLLRSTMLILAATAVADGRQLALKRRDLRRKHVATSGLSAIGVAMIEAAFAVDAAALAPP